MSFERDPNAQSAGAWPQFFDHMVHDLREPLRSVQAFSELLREIAGTRLGSEGDQAVGEILSGAARLRVLIEGLSRFAWSLEPGSEQAENKGCSLQLALDMTTISMDKAITACGAAVTGENLPRVGITLERLARLLENTIGNSLLFRGEAPPIIGVSARRDPDDPGWWLIRIEDNGTGIEPADREAVFKPFMRVYGRKYPGAGLGLSICRNLVENCGGRIWMDAAATGGSVCFFTLPAAED